MVLTNRCRHSAIQSQGAAKVAEQERRVSSMQADFTSREATHETNLAQARKVAQAEMERAQLRSEAEAADLRASISRLEVDLMKVGELAIFSMRRYRRM